jgi:AcrR family transcriptional regulator
MRERLISIAGQQFWKKGYLGTSVEEIAKAAKINKAMVYYYFNNKVDLLHEAILRANQVLHDQALSIINSNIQQEEKLKSFIINHVKYELNNLGISGVGQLERRNLPRKLLIEYNGSRDKYEALFRKIIAQGIGEGRFSSKDIRLTSLFTLGLVNSIVQWYRPKGRLSPDKIALEVYQYVRDALSVK